MLFDDLLDRGETQACAGPLRGEKRLKDFIGDFFRKWWDTPAVSKMLRLREHIEWAASHGCLEEVHLFLRELPEDQW